MGKSALLALMFALIAALVLGAGTLALLPQQTAPVAVAAPQAGRQAEFALGLEAAQAQADVLARQWAADAVLVGLSATWQHPDESQLLAGPHNWSLTFYSAERAAILYTAVAPGGARQVRQSPVYHSQPAVDATAWLVGPTEAAMLFLESGGRSFLAAHPGATVHINLGQGGGQTPVWSLLALSDGEVYSLAVDALSGEAWNAVADAGGGR